MNRVFKLIKKDFLRDWKNKSVLASLILYVLVSVFITYLSFNGTIDDPTWIALYWIIVTFSLINISLLSFNDDANKYFYYLRSIASPIEIIIGKIGYSFIVAIVLAVMASFAFMLFFGNVFEDFLQWFLVLLLGIFGLSNIFTLLSAISAKSKNMILLAILGLPIILPCILLLINLSNAFLVDLRVDSLRTSWISLVVLDFITIILALILFPYIWRE